MDLPCTIKALKYVSYSGNLKMSPNSTAKVTLEAEQGNNRYRSLRVTTTKASICFTEKALENAIARGDFSIT